MDDRPTVEVVPSDDGERWIVQIDTFDNTGVVTVYLNDGLLYEGNPQND